MIVQDLHHQKLILQHQDYLMLMCMHLQTNEKYFGYVVKGAKLTGVTSGAVATVTSINLFSDNWGDVIGAFFFRNANQTPKPPTLFTSGTKTFKITSSRWFNTTTIRYTISK